MPVAAQRFFIRPSSQRLTLPIVVRATEIVDSIALVVVSEAGTARERGHQRQPTTERSPAELEPLGDIEDQIELAVAPAHPLADVGSDADAATGMHVRRWIQCSVLEVVEGGEII
jgi:hypothetical protein